ncbi:MAG: hypothetical protein OXH56_02020, partial [Gemmatimonadetes bacterium]|nr:hypothetical protein [Gemmatimonadota bacterium]
MNNTSDSSASAGSSEQSCSAVAAYLVEHYGLAPPVDVRELEPGANRNFIITSQDQRYVYRIYTDHEFYVRNPEAYRYELDLLAYLKEHKLAVPEPVKRLDGQLLSVMGAATDISSGPQSANRHPWCNGACGALFRFFEGEEHVTWYPEVKEPVV